MEYVRICEGTVETKGRLIPANKDIYSIIDADKPNYKSIFLYTQDHYNQYKATGSVRGITNVTTNRLVFDFDSIENREQSRQDAIALCTNLTRLGVNKDDLQICFSGGKGYSVELETNKRFTPEEFRAINAALTEGLVTNDPKITNASRVFRIPQTKHNETGLYKLPITLDILKSHTSDSIATMAKSLSSIDPYASELKWGVVELPEDIYKLRTYAIKMPPVVQELTDSELSLQDKPKYLTNCRWALQNGLFKAGNRNFALLCLAATYKNMGFNKELVYRMLKGVAELQSKRYGEERYPDSQIYNNVLLQVFSDGWKGGQYSCKEPGNELFLFCKSLGDKSCKHDHREETKPRGLVDVTSSFDDYVKNIEKNTIRTGIPSLDSKLFISTGQNVGIVGAASSGKTSLILNILNNTSKAGIKSVFASLDMHSNRMYEKVMYKITGLSRDQLYKTFKEDPKKKAEIVDKLQKEFGNVFFYDRSTPTVADLKEYILDCQEQSGEKIKLVVLDYFERVNSDMSDDTASSKKIAGELQDLVNDLNIAIITLVQPNKMSLGGSASDPIYSYTAIKGSSFLYQSFRSIVSIWRPFFNPKDFSKDKYMQMAILKNDLGELSELNFGWDGKRGEIKELEDYEVTELNIELDAKEAARDKDSY